MSRRNDTRNLLIQYKRRLQGLKEKQARFGIETPVSILVEIQDIESEIEKLQTELRELEEDVIPVLPNSVKAKLLKLQDIESEIEKLQTELRELEEDVIPVLPNSVEAKPLEIQDIESEIEKLQTELRELEKDVIPVLLNSVEAKPLLLWAIIGILVLIILVGVTTFSLNKCNVPFGVLERYTYDNGCLIRINDSVWNEIVFDSKNVNYYKETNRDKDYITIYDESRDATTKIPTSEGRVLVTYPSLNWSNHPYYYVRKE